MADRVGTKAAWLSGLIGVAFLAVVIAIALHASEAEAFARLLEQAQPAWLAVAAALQAATYLAQGEIWRSVTRAAGMPLSVGLAYRLSVVKLLVDQALPSFGLSGAVVVAGALQRRGIGEDVTTAGMVVNASAYLMAYIAALGVGLAVLAAEGRASAPVLIAGGLFVLAAAGVSTAALRLSGTQAHRLKGRAHVPVWLNRMLYLLARAKPALVRNPRLIGSAAMLQLAIVALDALTLWALIRSLGVSAPPGAVFTSFMISTVLRTVSIVPAGLGAFEAASIFTLHGAGIEVPVALAATLLFRGFSFWLPMLPGVWLARRLLRQPREVHDATSSAGAYWSQDGAALLDALRSAASGLASEEAAQRLRRYGRNALEEERRSDAPRLLLRQLESPLMLILVLAAAISLFMRDWIEAAIILAIVLGSAVLGFVQEYRASAAVAGLRRRLALTVRVVRDGVEHTVPSADIVAGDLVVLSAGNLVPADGLVIEARDFLVSEASLTGESFPIEKRPGVVPAETPLARRTNCVFLGTSVRSGSARVIIAETGRATAFGEIAATIAARPQETDFARGVRHFGQLLMRAMVLIVLFVMTANQLLGRPALESLLFAVALAVGLTPELLPAIVSVTLSRGARELARRGVIVRRLETIEDLGSIDVLCTDKTGTLTAGVITLDAAVDCEGAPAPEVARLAFINATLETGIANPLDAAIVAAGDARGLARDTARKIDEIPYDFTRKRLTIVVENGDPAEHLMITKGAFENVLAICTIERALSERCRHYYRRMSAEGFRMLAVAIKRAPARPQYSHGDEREMTLAGFLLFLDPPKIDVAETIRDLAGLGIRVKMVTGDNRYVAAHVAVAVGLDPHAMLTGEELAKTKDEALWSLAARTDLFVEIDPQQKERIVRALQRTGHAVGYLGDGINDAPALHAADAGISVEGAVDVARESADVVLLERDLAVLHRGVVGGRATFANTLKYIAITTSANFGNMVSMALATPLLPFLPLAAKQILLNNFLSDLPSMAISTDRVDAERLETPQRWDLTAVRRFMIVFGLISSAFDLLTFYLLLQVFEADERTFQTAWFVVSVLTELAVLLVLRTHGPAWRSVPSPLLLWSTLAVVAATLALPYMGAAAALFGFVPLSLPLVGAVFFIVAGYIVTTEAVKLGFYAHKRR